MSLAAREILYTLREIALQPDEEEMLYTLRDITLHPEETFRAPDMAQVIVAAAHCANLNEDAVLGILSMAVHGADDRTLRAWLSADLGFRAGKTRDALTVLDMVVQVLGDRWETFPLEARHRMLEIGTNAVRCVNRHIAGRLHVV